MNWRWGAGSAILVELASSASASAQAATPIKSNDYTVEYFQGPLTAPVRVTSLGGAYTALAEGIEGAAVNAASPAVREPFSTRWFDYDVGAALEFPGAYKHTDFENRGERRSGGSGSFNNFLYLNLGAQAQLGAFGMAATVDAQSIHVESSRRLELQIYRFQGLLAYAFEDNQFIFGVGVRAMSMQFTTRILPVTESSIFHVQGIAPQIGVLVKPNNAVWRFGATFRAPVSARPLGDDIVQSGRDGLRRVDNFIIPNRVQMPWEFEFGLAVQIGARTLNPPWIDPRAREQALRAEILREGLLPEIQAARIAQVSRIVRDELNNRYDSMPRQKILLLASLLVAGPTNNAVGIQSFLDQRREGFGQSMTFSPRVGLEGEPIVARMKLRVGGYIEPSRFDRGTFRQHFTFGSEVKLIRFNPWGLLGDSPWRISAMVDLAPRFINWGLSIGHWH